MRSPIIIESKLKSHQGLKEPGLPEFKHFSTSFKSSSSTGKGLHYDPNGRKLYLQLDTSVEL